MKNDSEVDDQEGKDYELILIEEGDSYCGW